MKKYKVTLTCDATIETTVFAESPEEAARIAQNDASSVDGWDIDLECPDIEVEIQGTGAPEDCCGNCINYVFETLLCKIAGVPNDKSPYHTCCLYEPKEGGIA